MSSLGPVGFTSMLTPSLAIKGLVRLASLAALLGLAACGQSAEKTAVARADKPPVGINVLSATLRQALQQRSQVLSAKRTALPLSTGATVETCATYLEARKAGAQIAETVDAQLVSSEYLLCEAVDLLPEGVALEGKPAQVGARLAQQLDLRSFPSSLGPQLDEQRHTLASLSEAVKTDDVSAALEDESSTTRLEVVAQADLNQDSKPDWIVWLSDESRDGNYRGYATLVIDAAESSGPLTAKAYPAR